MVSLERSFFQFVLSCPGMTLANTVWAPTSHAATEESVPKRCKRAHSPGAAARIHAEGRAKGRAGSVDPETC